jgi:hypothetical protein
VPGDKLGVFYVIGPQDDTPQSEEAAFVHDHTVGGTPRQNHGTYRVVLRTFFVLCSAEGIASGARLFITDKTVEAHVRAIFTKLTLPAAADDHRRVQAVVAYLMRDHHE